MHDKMQDHVSEFDTFDRENTACMIIGLLPIYDLEEAKAVMDLATRQLALLVESRASRASD